MHLLKKLCASFALVGIVMAVTPAVALAAHSFKVTNNGTHQIDHVYLSNVDEDTWGPDQLDADETIDPGEHQTWRIPNDECLQDVKIVYHNGHSEVQHKFDTCKYDLEMSY
jgi:hypothetical protein